MRGNLFSLPLQEPGTYDEPFFAAWMASHQSACAALGKPLILEEFGKNSTVDEGLPVLEASIESIRAPVMSMVYDMFNASFSTGGNWRGACQHFVICRVLKRQIRALGVHDQGMCPTRRERMTRKWDTHELAMHMKACCSGAHIDDGRARPLILQPAKLAALVQACYSGSGSWVPTTRTTTTWKLRRVTLISQASLSLLPEPPSHRLSRHPHCRIVFWCSFSLS